MASSAADRAGKRVDLARRAIEAALAEGDARRALYLAADLLRGTWMHMSRQRPADAAFAAAQLAASITVTAGRLHALRPARPGGCPKVPGPDDLIAAYREVLEAAEGDTR